MREIDRLTTEHYEIPSSQLMENAATSTARFIIDSYSGDIVGKTVLTVCGKGNNGGDGAAASRLLANAGALVDVVLLGKTDETKGDARLNFDRLREWKAKNALRKNKNPANTSPGGINL